MATIFRGLFDPETMLDRHRFRQGQLILAASFVHLIWTCLFGIAAFALLSPSVALVATMGLMAVLISLTATRLIQHDIYADHVEFGLRDILVIHLMLRAGGLEEAHLREAEARIEEGVAKTASRLEADRLPWLLELVLLISVQIALNAVLLALCAYGGLVWKADIRHGLELIVSWLTKIGAS